MTLKNEVGFLEVICGCMFSGKTEELLRVLKRSLISKQKILVFKHASDIRYSTQEICSHNGQKISAHLIENTSEIFKFDLSDIDVVGIDEVQFFNANVIEDIEKLLAKKIRVVVAGLDLDYRKKPFGYMPQLLAMANKITKLTAICAQCGNDAFYSQRLNDTKQLVLVGATDYYEPRCALHHYIPENNII
ncbi:thymidine kinase [Pigmentibacter sp. JX0631]|uniref:thymidine kinase n=1 Tax=Pigmentibacter sp. JX0631 TaxID=2976982 RepID=UPI0024694F55|nr:thymidine kinase [Pigmentibacter sp. JX0631]WGL59667.1 thymidine kinase [Pigmentibacter sp. JX0631]